MYKKLSFKDLKPNQCFVMGSGDIHVVLDKPIYGYNVFCFASNSIKKVRSEQTVYLRLRPLVEPVRGVDVAPDA